MLYAPWDYMAARKRKAKGTWYHFAVAVLHCHWLSKGRAHATSTINHPKRYKLSSYSEFRTCAHIIYNKESVFALNL